jgi:hypothetical protein
MEALIAKYGVFKLACIAGVMLLVFFYGSILGIAKFRGWYYEHKADRLEAKLDTAKAEIKVARKDEAQVIKASEITAKTVDAQDNHAADNRAATNNIVEVIHERIKTVPVVVPVPDDPIVRDSVEQARIRAQASTDRLQGKTG